MLVERHCGGHSMPPLLPHDHEDVVMTFGKGSRFAAQHAPGTRGTRHYKLDGVLFSCIDAFTGDGELGGRGREEDHAQC